MLFLDVKYYIAQKHGNSVGAHASKVLSFSVTNEFGLENYLSYRCTKLGGNQRKWRPLASVDEREN